MVEINYNASLSQRVPEYYQKCKEDARDLLYLSRDVRVKKILEAWPIHFGFLDLAINDFNSDYKPKGFYIEHDSLYKRSLEFNNSYIGQFSLHKEPDSSKYDICFHPMSESGYLSLQDSKPFWITGMKKEKAMFVSDIVLDFLMSDGNSKKRIPSLINDYPDFVKYIFGIYGRS